MVLAITLIGGAFVVWFLLVLLFTPGIKYHVGGELDVTDDAFSYLLQTTCQAALHRGNRIDVLTDGVSYYPAMLEAIGRAEHTINLECYIFHPSGIGNRFIDALSARAGAGVRVSVVVDAIGSARLLLMGGARRLRDAGCRIERYQAFTWYRLARLNNRTHRELLVVDGRIAFVGGSGIADWWIERTHGRPAWRDTMARVEGPVVAGLQAVSVENWLECCGEIMVGPGYFPPLEPRGDTPAFVVKSSPSDRATVSRVVFQMLVEGARREICINTPYFLPDRAFRRALLRARRRGVRIRVVVPGRDTDQKLVRLASRRNYGVLLGAGVEIHEYALGMMHGKMLIVDRLWSVLGTTNIDNRSFEHNDEVNIAVRDPALAARLLEDFERDVARSEQVTLARWKQRSRFEKLVGTVVWVLERQQ